MKLVISFPQTSSFWSAILPGIQGGALTFPTKTMHNSKEISQHYHTFCYLFDPLEMLLVRMIPGKPKDVFFFQILGFIFGRRKKRHLHQELCLPCVQGFDGLRRDDGKMQLMKRSTIKQTMEDDGRRWRQWLVGGWTNPFEKYESNWESSPNRGENTKYLKPPPRWWSIWR